MNTDIIFCSNLTCRIKRYCKRGVDIKEGAILVSYAHFNCLSTLDEDYDFFLDNNLPIIVYETNPQETIRFANWIKFELDNNDLMARDDVWKYTWQGKLFTSEELYKIYKDGK